MSEPVLRLEGITKRFGPLVANDQVSLTLHAHEVLALLGENGAGKSTLVSILFGHYVADEGQITVAGKPLPPGQPRAALAAGIGMVHQHSTLADNLTVLDNVMLGTEPWWQPFSRRRAAQDHLREVSQRFGLVVDPQARVGDLSVGERQRVEILKALVRGARILILDEPTAVLTPQESDSLFATLAQMVEQGLGVIFISHKLDEVLRVSHRVAVMRAGKLVAQARSADTTASQLAQWMVGHALAPVQHKPAVGTTAMCSLRGVTTAGDGRDRLRGVDLDVRRGEIVAIAGVSGNGQAVLAELLSGMRHVNGGELRFDDAAMPADARALVQAGVARVPEDRRHMGVVGDMPVWENVVAERLATPAFSRQVLGWRWIRRSAARAHAARIVERFDVRGGGLDAPARSLSGGNMQKLILGRVLSPPDGSTPKLIVAHQPTWGLDIGAVGFVQQQLLAARDAGAAVLMISDDLDEVMALGDRIAVMYQGKLTPALPAAQWSREQLGLAMAGQYPADSMPAQASNHAAAPAPGALA